MVLNIKMAAIDGKQIANMLYHAGVETLLTVGYSELRKPATKVDFNIGDIEMLSNDKLLAMATHDMLIKQSIIPANIMKCFFFFFFIIFFTKEKMASAVARKIGGAVVNVLAFTGGNFFLFSKLGKSNDAGKERGRHDKTVERLGVAQTAWNKQRMQ